MSDTTGSEALSSQYLTVSLANEEYGIDILAVREIRGWTPVTRLPQSPACVLGVLNLRGAIVPVLDLRLRFGVERKAYTAATVTVVVAVGGRSFGIVVDAVSDVLDAAGADMRPVPDMGTTATAGYLQGLVAAGERMVLLLDLERLLKLHDTLDADAPAAEARRAA